MSRVYISRSMRRRELARLFREEEARLLDLPRWASLLVDRGSTLVRIESGIGPKEGVALEFSQCKRAGSLVFTRRPHFYIIKKKK